MQWDPTLLTMQQHTFLYVRLWGLSLLWESGITVYLASYTRMCSVCLALTLPHSAPWLGCRLLCTLTNHHTRLDTVLKAGFLHWELFILFLTLTKLCLLVYVRFVSWYYTILICAAVVYLGWGIFMCVDSFWTYSWNIMRDYKAAVWFWSTYMEMENQMLGYIYTWILWADNVLSVLRNAKW